MVIRVVYQLVRLVGVLARVVMVLVHVGAEKWRSLRVVYALLVPVVPLPVREVAVLVRLVAVPIRAVVAVLVREAMKGKGRNGTERTVMGREGKWKGKEEERIGKAKRFSCGAHEQQP